ncbi:MAG: type II secretion system protein [Methylophilaceae bacterium]
MKIYLYLTNKNQGFTLVEMSIVLVVIGLLVAAFLTPLSAHIDQRNYGETNKRLEEAKEALYGYALSHAATTDGRPYLPCPDTNNDGLEEVRNGAGVCPSQEGRLAWVTLGLERADSWGNLFRYRVHPNFSNSATGFSLSSLANLRVCQNSACSFINANDTPAIIVSHGKNGYGSYNGESGTVIQVPVSLGADELANMDGRDNPRPGNNTADTVDTANVDFVSTVQASTFDDVVVWVSPNILFNRMVAAGRLP